MSCTVKTKILQTFIHFADISCLFTVARPLLSYYWVINVIVTDKSYIIDWRYSFNRYAYFCCRVSFQFSFHWQSFSYSQVLAKIIPDIMFALITFYLGFCFGRINRSKFEWQVEHNIAGEPVHIVRVSTKSFFRFISNPSLLEGMAYFVYILYYNVPLSLLYVSLQRSRP